MSTGDEEHTPETLIVAMRHLEETGEYPDLDAFALAWREQFQRRPTDNPTRLDLERWAAALSDDPVRRVMLVGAALGLASDPLSTTKELVDLRYNEHELKAKVARLSSLGRRLLTALQLARHIGHTLTEKALIDEALTEFAAEAP